MTDIVFPVAPARGAAGTSYLDEGHTLMSWLTTTDHKRIAILYALAITFFFFIGGAAIGVVRLQLLFPQGGLVTSDEYNRLFTLHGIVMVWFFLVPSIPTTMGNFLLPLMIGARDVAFPRLNLLSWYLYIVAAAFTLYVIVAGGVDTGWTFYAPFSTTYSTSHVALAALGVFVSGFSSIATGVNFITTIHMLRAPGMTWFRLPLFVWSSRIANSFLLQCRAALMLRWMTGKQKGKIYLNCYYGLYIPALVWREIDNFSSDRFVWRSLLKVMTSRIITVTTMTISSPGAALT